METLYNEFQNINKMKMFEIEVEGEHVLYNIEANEKGLSARLYCDDEAFIEWDDCFTLDEHLQDLYELCCNDANEAYNKRWL
jgi:hypothetical protein